MLKNHTLAKSISDSGWGTFVRMLEYKAAWYNSSIEQVDRFFPSSKLCSSCGVINETLTLKDRFWVCECGVQHDRDANAALNILHFSSAGTARIYAAGDDVRPARVSSRQAAVNEGGSPIAFSVG